MEKPAPVMYRWDEPIHGAHVKVMVTYSLPSREYGRDIAETYKVRVWTDESEHHIAHRQHYRIFRSFIYEAGRPPRLDVIMDRRTDEDGVRLGWPEADKPLGRATFREVGEFAAAVAKEAVAKLGDEARSWRERFDLYELEEQATKLTAELAKVNAAIAARKEVMA